MLKISKKDLELNIIPILTLILSIVVGVTESKIVIKVVTLIAAILLGMQIERVVYKIKEG